MSVHVSARAWQRMDECSSDGERLVLLALADYANSEGIAWPKSATLAEKCATSVRTVERHLAALRERGMIVRVARGGRGRGTTYEVLPLTLLDGPEKVRQHDGGDSGEKVRQQSGGESQPKVRQPVGGDSVDRAGQLADVESPPGGADFTTGSDAESPPDSAESPPELWRGSIEPGTVSEPEGQSSSSDSEKPVAASVAVSGSDGRDEQATGVGLDSPQPQPEEEGMGTDADRELAMAEMTAYANRKAQQIQDQDPEHGRRAAARFLAGCEMLIEDGVGSWRDPHRGGFVPWPKRPPIFREAVLHHLAEPGYNLKSSLAYTLKYALDPARDAEETVAKEAAAKAEREGAPIDDRVQQLAAGAGRSLPRDESPIERRTRVAQAWCAENSAAMESIEEEAREALIREHGSESQLAAAQRRSPKLVEGIARALTLGIIEARMRAGGTNGG